MHYYIRNGAHLFLFENKDIFINADIKQGGNYEKLESEIQKKLYFEVKQNQTVYKGVYQLATNVKRALLAQNAFDTNHKATSLNVYPILVLHDPSFNALGFNYVVDSWFQIELQMIAAEGIGISRVRPVTVIYIDTLILFGDFLRAKKMSLEALIDGYIKHSTFDSKKHYKNEEHLKSAYADTFYPFSLFIHKFTKNGNATVPFGLMKTLLPDIFQSNQG